MEGSTTKKCQGCHKDFLIIPQEMGFYEKKRLPFPAQCHECRCTRRRGLRNGRQLAERKCAQCGVALLSTYPKDTPYIVYCEACYFKEVN